MFAKIDENKWVNLRHVSRIELSAGIYYVWLNDERATKVETKDEFRRALNMYNQMFQRMALGNFKEY